MIHEQEELITRSECQEMIDADILEKKDRIINPRKYYKNTEEVKPWD